MPTFSKEELIIAHSYSFKNKDDVSKSNKCSCFHCFKTFPAMEIDTFLSEKDGNETALCPYCMCDTIICDASKVAISDDLIDAIAYEYLHGLTRSDMKDFDGPEIVVLD